ncbi:hypothetical protein J5N97_012153 [Dioscorea zingiberensis]|uniref:Late embryogenesis abundant protein LEA-2 subgroup domain-containing protein n=1 Tax=Dioscorea zingiberensis TaxID=325984 RepID=A0A9D5CQV1_9LILI|nr:hypothetical protein J5N97_012117 [Dioscorea zingiberensis]KAJ0976679.1 hypothetical protein J5N97_012153 [Dioscorea zingiberensis]
MSGKDDCGNHGSCKRRKFYRRAFACILAIIVLILLIILIVWLALRPTKPRFYLQDANVQQFNLSSSYLLTSYIQVTISSRNPNDKVGIYYDKLDTYASYKSQQITLPSALPTGYQGHGDVEVWSPYLVGSTVPIAPYLSDSLQQDESAGLLLLYIKIDGRLRWKVGSWISGHYHIYVNCPALLTFGDGKANGYSPSLKFRQISTCSVDV